MLWFLRQQGIFLPLPAFMYGCHGMLAVNVEFKIEM